MHISKITLGSHTKLFSAHYKLKDHAKGFPTYLVPYKNRQCLRYFRC